jgi:hypothetical protein
VLTAYLDASSQGGIVSVAGFVYERPQAKKAHKAWTRLWGDVPCHMTDFHNRKRAFKHWTTAEIDDRMKRMIPLMRSHTSLGVAFSCDEAEVARLAPQDVQGGHETYLYGFRTPYALCAHMAMTAIGHYVSQWGQASLVAYVLESGDAPQSELGAFVSSMVAHRDSPDSYRYLSHTFVSKRDARMLEMADVFAWEWARLEVMHRKGLSPRSSLRALLGDLERPHFHVDFLTGPPLERCYRQIAGLRRATTREEVSAAIRLPKA